LAARTVASFVHVVVQVGMLALARVIGATRTITPLGITACFFGPSIAVRTEKGVMGLAVKPVTQALRAS
jgi:hypothetical protein